MTTTEAPYRRMLRSRPAVDPRLRQRWVDARRQEGRRRLRVLAAAGGATLVAAAGLAVVHSSVFRVRHVHIVGTNHEAPMVVAAAAGLDRQALMVDFSPSSAVEAIEALPWVATVKVLRQWPSTVSIAVTERRAVADVLLPQAPTSGPAPAPSPAPSPPAPGAAYAEVDGTGRVLAVASTPTPGLPLLPAAGVPVAVGQWLPNSDHGVIGRGASPSVTGPLRLAAVLGSASPDPVTSISSAGGSLRATVGTTTFLLGDASSLAAKATALRTVAAQVDLKGVTKVDLRVPDRPVLTSAGTPASVSTTSTG